MESAAAVAALYSTILSYIMQGRKRSSTERNDKIYSRYIGSTGCSSVKLSFCGDVVMYKPVSRGVDLR